MFSLHKTVVEYKTEVIFSCLKLKENSGTLLFSFTFYCEWKCGNAACSSTLKPILRMLYKNVLSHRMCKPSGVCVIHNENKLCYSLPCPKVSVYTIVGSHYISGFSLPGCGYIKRMCEAWNDPQVMTISYTSSRLFPLPFAVCILTFTDTGLSFV